MSKPKQFNRKDAPMMSYLEDIGVDFNRTDHTHYKSKSAGFMDLTIETWMDGKTKIVSVCQYGEQNGDAMRDPDVVYRLDGVTGIEIPISYQNDYLAKFQEVFTMENDVQMINPSLLQELKVWSRQWSKILREQGHLKAVEQNS